MKKRHIALIIFICGVILSIIFIGLDIQILRFFTGRLPIHNDWSPFLSTLVYIFGGIATARICIAPTVLATIIGINIMD